MPLIIGILAAAVQKAFATFSDNFGRTTSGSLGTSSSGGLWEAIRGVWFADGSAAKSTDTVSTYPISAIKMSSTSTTASVSTGAPGTLIASSGTVGTIASGDGTTGVSGFFWATVTVTSTTGVNVGDWIYATNGTGSLYGGTPDYVEVTSIVTNTSITYRTKGGTVPTAGTVTNIYTRGNDGGSGIALWVTDSGNWWGVTYGRSIDTACNCSVCSANNCNGYTNYASSYCAGYTNYASSYCSGYTNYASSYCGGYSTGTSYSCSGGYSAGGTTYYCNTGNYGTGYSCNGSYSSSSTWGSYSSNGTYSCTLYVGGVCVVWSTGYVNGSTTTYSCSGGFYTYPTWSCTAWTSGTAYSCGGFTSSTTWSCSGGNYTAYSPACSGGSYTAYSPACSGGSYTAYSPACSGGYTTTYSVCNCQTCYPPYIRVIQSTSNVVSEITRWTLTSMAGAFKVIVNAATKVITIRPYKETSMTTQIGSDLTYTATSATIDNKFGIVLSPSDQIQGNQLDDFTITSN
jgi:hypothetical protein